MTLLGAGSFTVDAREGEGVGLWVIIEVQCPFSARGRNFVRYLSLYYDQRGGFNLRPSIVLYAPPA